METQGMWARLGSITALIVFLLTYFYGIQGTVANVVSMLQGDPMFQGDPMANAIANAEAGSQ